MVAVPELEPIRCRGCHQAFAWGTGAPGVRVYCSGRCAYNGPMGENEERNHLLRHVVAAGWTAAKTANWFGLSRQRVNQMLNRKEL